jgi:hypothetical protein
MSAEQFCGDVSIELKRRLSDVVCTRTAAARQHDSGASHDDRC